MVLWREAQAACAMAMLRWLGCAEVADGRATQEGLLEVRGFRLPCCWEIVGICSLRKVSGEDNLGALQRRKLLEGGRRWGLEL
ncbi:hypothetical protein Taro_040138 [Colocasia esculenta]|uniref:Uncharacterized protein n=1 Tax=Colocasia esculenta TaxID=4460 RepID=A0A843WKX5_COLES|nr:hypothetical protein [Colocasia esculenta]